MSHRLAVLVALLLIACPPAEEPAPVATPEPTPEDVLAPHRGGPVDLSPDWEVGQTVATSTTTRSSGITRIPGIGTVDKDSTESHDFTAEILAAENGEPTRVRVRHARFVEATTLKPEGAEAIRVEVPRPLHEVTEIQELVNGSWKRAIEGGIATPEQELVMRPSGAVFASGGWFPGGVAVGDSWTVEGTDLVSLFGGMVTEEPKGSIEITLVELQPCDGAPCARLRVSGRVTGKVFNPQDPRRPIRAVLDLSGTALRSLEAGISVAESFEGTVESAGRLPVEDQLVDFTLNGRIEVNSSGRLE